MTFKHLAKGYQHLIWAGLLWAGLLAQVQAATSQEAIDDVISRYPRAEVAGSRTATVADYRLATGAARKVGGRWAPESELRREGELSTLTMQIPEGHGPQEVFQYYRQRLAALDARIIYRCRERNCGSSNSWANDIFGEKQLYGLDQDQYYGLFEIVDDDDQLNYVAVYTVRRGNRRVYAHLELLQTSQKSAASVAPNPDSVAEQLQEEGYYDVSGLSLDGEQLQFRDEHLEAVAEALRSSRRLSLRIVGHDYSRGSLEEQLLRSHRYALQVAERLKAAGVPEDRIEAHGVGSLVPPRITSGNRDREFRVELVAR